MLKRSIALFLVLILALFTFAGCKQETSQTNETKQNEETSNTVEEQVLTYNVGTNPDSIDPGLCTENIGSQIIANTYEALVKLDDNGDAVPAAAERWEVSEDQTEYTFFLREDAKWSDGKPLTANDFVYSWRRVVNPETAAEFSYFLYSLKNAEKIVEGEASPDELGVEAIDKKTLKVTLETPVNYMFDLFAFFVYCPVREDIVSANPEKWTLSGEVVSNGPFIVKEWKQNEEVVLVKNENYWRADEVKLQEIRFPLINDNSTALAAYEAGDIDGSYFVPATDIPRLTAESDEFYMNPALDFKYLEFNATAKPFDDARVRKAFTLAINRKDLTSKVTLGGEKPAVGVVPYGVHLGGEDFRENGGTYDIDPNNARIEEARKLLAEAGYPEGEGLPPIEFNIASDSTNQRIAEAIIEMWKTNLGTPDISIIAQEGKVHYSDLGAGNYQVGTGGWLGDFPHPMAFLEMWQSESGDNETQFGSEEYDELIKKARITKDTDKALEYMHAAEDLWMSHYVVCPLHYSGQPVLMKKYVKGFRMNSLAMMYLDEAYIEGKEE